jgi:ferric-dicitrate binding protein FerR (iron transport regulator)
MDPASNKQLLFLYWSGRATPMQRQLIADWLVEPAHREQFYAWLVEWEEQHPQSDPDSDNGWATLSARLAVVPAAAPALPETPTRRGRVGTRWMTWWLAASLVLAGGLGWLLRDALVFTTYQSAYGQVLPLSLPDGSTATLNANSQLRLLRPWLSRLTGGERVVWLRGEANFKVTHQADHRRFVVRTDNPLDVVVLGTEFSVTARPVRFRVALHSGRVVLRTGKTPQEKALTLQPGDVFTQAARQRAVLRHHQPTQSLVTWQAHEFVFDHTSLPEVLTMLHDQFGVTVRLRDDSLATAQITGRFRAERADDLLLAVTTLTGYRLVEQDGVKTLVP